MVITLLTLSVVCNIFLIWKCFSTFDIVDEYEEYFIQLQRGLQVTLEQITRIDVSGAFDHDDEVGLIFSGIRGMITSLSQFLVKGS